MSDHLFAEMNAIADALHANDPMLRESLSDELQLEFRQLPKKRMPWLGKVEFVDLFHEWRDRYLGQLEAELAEYASAGRRTTASWLRRSPSATPATPPPTSLFVNAAR